MTRSAATIFTLLSTFTGPPFTPGKLTLVLSPTSRVNGLPGIGTAPIVTLMVAGEALTFPNRNWLSRSTLLYQGIQYVVCSWLAGNPIISEKLVGVPLTL